MIERRLDVLRFILILRHRIRGPAVEIDLREPFVLKRASQHKATML